MVEAISTTRRRSSSVYLMAVLFLGRLASAGRRPSANLLRHRVTLHGESHFMGNNLLLLALSRQQNHGALHSAVPRS